MSSSKIKLTPVTGIVGGIACILVLWLGVSFIMHQVVANRLNTDQNNLMAEYNDTAVSLTKCEQQTKASVGAATANSDAVAKIVVDAVKGRYNHDAQGNPTTSVNNSLVLQAVQEAYPNTNNVSEIYRDALTTINGCQSDFADAQQKLQADIAVFKTHRNGSWTARKFGGTNYPTSDLEITVGGNVLTGKNALRQLQQIVATSGARTARDSGTVSSEDPFASK
jgi:hypothetical protein